MFPINESLQIGIALAVCYGLFLALYVRGEWRLYHQQLFGYAIMYSLGVLSKLEGMLYLLLGFVVYLAFNIGLNSLVKTAPGVQVRKVITSNTRLFPGYLIFCFLGRRIEWLPYVQWFVLGIAVVERLVFYLRLRKRPVSVAQ